MKIVVTPELADLVAVTELVEADGAAVLDVLVRLVGDDPDPATVSTNVPTATATNASVTSKSGT